MSKLVEDLGVQINNTISPSAQWAEAVNEARLLIFMIRCSFQDLSKSAFISLYGAVVRPHLEYGMPVCLTNVVGDVNHRFKITEKVDNWLSSSSLRKETAEAGRFNPCSGGHFNLT